jgi:hypothetical protein
VTYLFRSIAINFLTYTVIQQFILNLKIPRPGLEPQTSWLKDGHLTMLLNLEPTARLLKVAYTFNHCNTCILIANIYNV